MHGWKRRLDLALPPRGARAFVASDLLSTVGSGLFVTGGTLFFTRAADLSVGQTSGMLTVAGIVGLITTIPIGQLTDRVGPREVSIVLLGVRALATVSFVIVPNFLGLLIAAIAVLISDRGLQASFGALTAAVGGAQRVHLQAYLRAVTNVGLSLGSLAAAPFLAADSRTGYVALIGTNAAVIGAAALIMFAVQRVPPVPTGQRADAWAALRDRPYLAVTALHGMLGLQYDVLAYALPLWVAYGTDAPPWSVAFLLATNTVLVAVLQVPVSKAASTVTIAARLGRRAGGTFLISLAILATAHFTNNALTIVILFAGVLVHTVGELWHAASSFTLSFELAQEHAHGQYQGVFALGRGIERAVAPGLLGMLCVQWGPPGWVLLGIAFCVTGSALPKTVALAFRPDSQIIRGRSASP